MPSKNIIHSAKVASLVTRHREFGIETGPIAIGMAGVYARKRQMVDEIVQIHLKFRFKAQWTSSKSPRNTPRSSWRAIPRSPF
jgi:pyruvate/2-oxoglutarate dehydrogenase complex dihydrolipoamide dehydrogenase (E3) component